ncbi:MAG: hypothetical protein AABM40_14900 [Chloroflexota bacterium]
MLARAGATVALHDRGGPNDELVELLSGRARRLTFEALKLQPNAIDGVEVAQTLALWGERLLVRDAIANPWGAAVSVVRGSFDGALRAAARAAGVRVCERSRVVGVAGGPPGGAWSVGIVDSHGRFRQDSAELVIFASGSIRRRSRARADEFVGLLARYGNAADAWAPMLVVERTQTGWWYALPHPAGGTFIGYCVPRQMLRRRRIPLAALFHDHLGGTRLISQILPAAPLGRVRGRSSSRVGPARAAGRRWIAVGDSAHASDPLSGQGLEFAIESAQRASRAVLEDQSRAYVGWVEEVAEAHSKSRGEWFPN